MRYLRLVFAVIFIFCTCKLDQQANKNNGPSNKQYPVLIPYDAPVQSYFYASCMYRPAPRVMAVSNNRDTLDLSSYNSDTSFYIGESSAAILDTDTGINIFVDTSGKIPIHLSSWIYETGGDTLCKYDVINSTKDTSVELKSYDWQYMEDNDIRADVYPVYIWNISKDPIIIERNYGVPLIQEVKGKAGRWQPVEYWNNIPDDTPDGSIKLLPGYYLLTGVVIYKGTFETKMRVKFRCDGKGFYSNHFRGSVNPSQFKIRSFMKEEGLSRSELKEKYFLSSK